MGQTVGIDLGTTNSVVAAIDARGEAFLIHNEEGERTTPSWVAEREGEVIVSSQAKRQAAMNPTDTLHSVKRLMGRSYADEAVKEARARVGYAIEAADNGDAWVRLGSELLAPPELAALVLRKLKSDAERVLGDEVTDAVVTVPAHFDNDQRNATHAAGEIAGLNVARIINEPTAAALGYGLGPAVGGGDSGTSRLAVYDFGGGTFDISILRLSEGLFQVESTSGDTFLVMNNHPSST